jgi:methanogenic corrinoid protein MtbC1
LLLIGRRLRPDAEDARGGETACEYAERSPMSTEAAARLRTTLDERLVARDREGGVRAAVDAVTSGAVEPDELYTHVLSPLLADTGAAWQQGTTMVWEEHFATAMVRTIIESLFLEVRTKAASVPRLGKVAVLACPPGEFHDLGLRMLADRMQLHGWDAFFLGADTPVDEIVSAAKAFKADLVALSAATHYNRLLLREVVDGLKRSLPGVRIGVGGPAFAQDRSWPADELLSEADLGVGSPTLATPASDEGEG